MCVLNFGPRNAESRRLEQMQEYNTVTWREMSKLSGRRSAENRVFRGALLLCA